MPYRSTFVNPFAITLYFYDIIDEVCISVLCLYQHLHTLELCLSSLNEFTTLKKVNEFTSNKGDRYLSAFFLHIDIILMIMA